MKLKIKKIVLSFFATICLNTAYTQCPNGTACDDGNLCTINDYCVNGVCVGMPRNCNDGNICTDDFCDSNTGSCFFVYNNTHSCNDNNPCTINDHCVNGGCVGTPVSGVTRTVTSTIDFTPNCLRDIINQSCQNDIIVFAVDTSFITSPIVLPHNINLLGSDTSNTVINGENSTSMITIPASITASFSNLSFINGYSANNGGAFYNQGYLYVKNIILKHNYEGAIAKAFSGSGGITILTSTSLIIEN
ncbi:MAG: hypothetical protein ABL929_05745 [Ferruginibacter sp.]|nr:hypothetical protein [Ferruginibacter sp.]